MEKISLMEFKEYCAKLSPKQYVFSSEYQTEECPLGVELTFLQRYILVRVFLAPNSIAFRNDSDSQLVFDCVKYVKVPKKAGNNGVRCEIVCGNAHSGCCDTTYTIVIF